MHRYEISTKGIERGYRVINAAMIALNKKKKRGRKKERKKKEKLEKFNVNLVACVDTDRVHIYPFLFYYHFPRIY